MCKDKRKAPHMTDTPDKPETARDLFRRYMAKRRTAKRGSLEHEWITAACRKYVWIMRGVPTTEWTE